VSAQSEVAAGAVGRKGMPRPSVVCGGLAGIATRNAFPIVLTALIAVTLTLLSPDLLVADSWLTLVGGREIVQHGIPHIDVLTVWGNGHRWTDQQWLAQLAWYGVDRSLGLRGVALLGVVAVVVTFASAMAAARLLGATARSTFLVAFVAMFAAPWSWQIRAQTLALPLFVWTLWLAVDHVRRPSRRIIIALPVLAIWANVHGSVLVGAVLVALAGLFVGARRRTLPAVGLGLGLAASAAVCSVATPYGTDVFAYYRLMLINPPFAGAINEWDRTTPSALTATFLVLAAITVTLALWQRRRNTVHELAVLAITLGGAFQAIRGIVWFVLAAVVILPKSLDAAIKKPNDVKLPRANFVLALIALTSTAVVFAVVAAKPDSWFERPWPTRALAAVEAAGPEARVLASDRHADWLLWHLPNLRGRLAYDVRFELYSRPQIIALSHYDYQHGRDWRRIAKGYDVFVVDEQSHSSLTAALLKQPGTRATYRDRKISVLVR
jgi:hypothetical protein